MLVSKIVSGKKAKKFWQYISDNIAKEWMTPPMEGNYKTLPEIRCVFVSKFVRKKFLHFYQQGPFAN